ncbi:nicotinate phosphoribosyltransferase [Candidatus Gottesmanbacteria bacterium]|nr:nicotinate phosphoribosyltransferase [Candidatus Gottesmanbacteria bacterium]
MSYWNQEIIDQIRKGYYSAVYFKRTQEILIREKNFKPVLMQIFQKHEGSTLCGVEEVIDLLKSATGYFEGKSWIDKSGEFKIKSLQDGDKLSAGETVMHIIGPYAYFAHLESVYLGILARRTLIATKTREVVEAASGKNLIFFADRFDYFLNQIGDGYAAKIGGASAICTPAMSDGFGQEPVGTIPHSLIAVCDGNTVEAAKVFTKHYPEVKPIVLVDFDNDCVKTSLEVARALGKRLWGIRIDTAENVKDKSLTSSKFKVQSSKLNGVNPVLVKLVRKALDQEGFFKVKIVVSGGFNKDKVKLFEKEKTPVDIYGVGSALVHGENDFTGDVVKVGKKQISKAGREFIANSRLKLVK